MTYPQMPLGAAASSANTAEIGIAVLIVAAVGGLAYKAAGLKGAMIGIGVLAVGSAFAAKKLNGAG